MYEVKPIKTQNSTIPLRGCMKEGVIARFPSSVCISGRSGSGKTQLLMNMMTNPDLLGNYFHYTLVFSPTAGEFDDTYAPLELPKENFVQDFGPEQLEAIIDARKKLIKKKGKKWVAENSRVCIILDDVIANRDFLESQVALKLFALLRHYLCSIFILIQSFTKLPRSLRLNCNSIYVFPASRSEVEILLSELCPAELTKKEFLDVINHCCDGDYNFLSINNHAKKGQHIRRNLTDVIDLNKFKKA